MNKTYSHFAKTKKGYDGYFLEIHGNNVSLKINSQVIFKVEEDGTLTKVIKRLYYKLSKRIEPLKNALPHEDND